MKLRLLPVLFLLVAPLGASSVWGQSLHRVFSQDGTDVWAVGHAGLVYRSFDGGLSWTQRTVGAVGLYDAAAVGFNVILVGDAGQIWHSTDSGGAWTLFTVAGVPDLRAVSMPSVSVAYAAGNAGTIVKTVDGGESWTPQSSGTGADLSDIRFTDTTHGWAVGDGGTVLRTTDGGASWDPVPAGTANDLLAVDQSGATVWVVGVNATAKRSTNGGSSWEAVDLELDDLADVEAVHLASESEAYLAGGGGFIRRSTDGGATWTFQQHQMQAEIRGLHFVGSAGWAASHGNGVILYTTDGGDTWHFPAGSSVSRSWEMRLTASGMRGGTISNHPTNKHSFYVAIAGTVYKSLDDGENWSPIGTIPGATTTNAFVVSPKDTTRWVAAINATSGKIARTVNAGGSWTFPLSGKFGSYGVPIEMHPDKPDTLFFGADDDSLYRSTDFGLSWSQFSTAPVRFRSPCDILVIPGDGDVVLLGDGVTGDGVANLFKSVNGGQTFSLKLPMPSNASESPELAGSRLRKNVAFATSWALGNFYRTTDQGSTWDLQTTASSSWGVDVSRDDPNLVIFGRFTGGETRLSFDGGETFTTTPIASNNYSFYARDRAAILAAQADGVYKMRFTYSNTTNNSQSLALASPDGGESWSGGETRTILWSASNVAVARIEYQGAIGAPWQFVADVPGYLGSYDWTVPYDPTTEARIRVRDLWDDAPRDSSTTRFTIDVPLAVGDPLARMLRLWQNQPNPFDGSTTIRYSLPAEAAVTLDVFDVQGHRVASLVRDRQAPGTHAVRFGHDALGADGRTIGRLRAGVYFYRLQAGGSIATRKMLLTR